MQNISSDDDMDAHGLFTSPKDSSDELGESMSVGINLISYNHSLNLLLCFHRV